MILINNTYKNKFIMKNHHNNNNINNISNNKIMNLKWINRKQKNEIFKLNMKTIIWLFIYYCCINLFEICSAQSIDHCFTHRYEESANRTYMQFTKEIINTEYAVLGEFKSLHCCAKGYRSIEWFKDGKPYPWQTDFSSLILYPEAANQTIYTRQIQFADVGNYTCVLRNDTHKRVHQISLEVQGNLPDMPLPTFKPRDQTVELGNPARLYCEAFVGKVGLPDARSIVSWYQVFEGEQEQEADGIQEQVSRENGQIVGAYLTIQKVQLHNYGRYLCRIQIGNEAHRLEMYALLYGSPIEAEKDQTLLLGLLAAIFAVILVLLTWFLVIWFTKRNRKNQGQCQMLAGRNELDCTPRRV